MKTTAASTSLAALAAAVGLVVSAVPAHAATDELHSVDAQLLADGAAVQATIEFTCTKGWNSTVGVAISQTSGRNVAIGRYYQGFLGECTGKRQTLEAVVLPDTLAFREDTAVVWVTLDLCPKQEGVCRSGKPLVLEMELSE